MLEAYRDHVADRAAMNIPPKPLSPQQVADLVELLKAPPASEEDYLVDLISNRVPPGVDEAAYVKAAFLKDLALEKISTELISPEKSIQMLGTMLGGYSVEALVEVLKSGKYGSNVVSALKNTSTSSNFIKNYIAF